MDPYEDEHRKMMSPLDKKEPHAKEEIVEKEPISKETVVDHLEELRKQLTKSAFVFIFFLVVVFSTLNLWFPYIIKGNQLIILGPLEVIKFYTSISVTLSLGLSLPFLIHFLWQFIKPGLESKEARFLGLYSPLMLFLFISGISFGYFVVNPLSYQFLVGLGAMNFSVMVSAQQYVHFLIMTTVPLGLLFELPIVVMFLSTVGLLTSTTMVKARKWSYVVSAVLSAIITPPDFISQLLVLIPMIALYETSIVIIRRLEAKQQLTEEL